CGDSVEQALPADAGLHERPNGGAGRRSAGYRAEQPAQCPAALVERYDITYERETDRHHTTRADPGGDPPRHESRHTFRCRGGRGENNEQRQRTEDDRAPSEAV